MGLAGKGSHVALRTPRMRGNEIRHYLIGQTVTAAHLVKYFLEFIIEIKGRLTHQAQHMV